MASPSPLFKKETIHSLLDGFLYKNEQIPIIWLEKLMNALNASQNSMAKLMGVSTRTLQRELEHKQLSKDLSDRFLQLLDLYKEGVEAFFTIDNFQSWLKEEQVNLYGNRPIELIQSVSGIQQVKEEILRLKHGIIS